MSTLSNSPVATTGLALYNRAAETAAATVIGTYSTSFSLACRLLGPRPRPHVRNIYALVRVADEVVDGPCHAAGLSAEAISSVLDSLENETYEAIERGFSANLVVHAFARTARECGIGQDLIAPFFASMRTDLTRRVHDHDSHGDYVYGSAEVVGLMCLQVFVNAGAPQPLQPAADLVDAARRLGSAFQDVNFLRDMDDDANGLGRDYLGVGDGLTSRTRVLDRIDADLRSAATMIPVLPADCRRAVTAAHDLFASLSTRLRADDGSTARVRVPAAAKARLAARAWLGLPPKEMHQ